MKDRDDDEARASERSVPRLPIAPSMGPALETISAPFERANVDARVLGLSGLGIGLGLVAAVVARVLTALIGLITNLAFYGRWSTEPSWAPPATTSGGVVVLVPVVGGLIVGLMARYGSQGHPRARHPRGDGAGALQREPHPRAHDVPEAALGGGLDRDGRALRRRGTDHRDRAARSARSSARSCASPPRSARRCSPPAPRRACPRRSASPVSAVLLAIELLLFEYRPRSLIPVALASAAACGAHMALVGSAAGLRDAHGGRPGRRGARGLRRRWALSSGVASMLVTRAVYAVEDAFEKLPIHWMWWPALGGVVVGRRRLAVAAHDGRRLRQHRPHPVRAS